MFFFPYNVKLYVYFCIVINQKENTIKAFGTAMIIVLFLFFCTSISDKSFSPNKHSSQLGSASEFNINNGKAVVVEAFKWSSFQKSFSLIRNLFNDNFKSVADNNKITRSLNNVCAACLSGNCRLIGAPKFWPSPRRFGPPPRLTGWRCGAPG